MHKYTKYLLGFICFCIKNINSFWEPVDEVCKKYKNSNIKWQREFCTISKKVKNIIDIAKEDNYKEISERTILEFKDYTH